MTDEERAAMHQRAREQASEYSYEDHRSGRMLGTVLEVRKSPGVGKSQAR